MTGAGRLSSGPQPVTANAAPLFLSCIVDRRRRRKSAPAAASVRDGSPKGRAVEAWRRRECSKEWSLLVMALTCPAYRCRKRLKLRKGNGTRACRGNVSKSGAAARWRAQSKVCMVKAVLPESQFPVAKGLAVANAADTLCHAGRIAPPSANCHQSVWDDHRQWIKETNGTPKHAATPHTRNYGIAYSRFFREPVWRRSRRSTQNARRNGRDSRREVDDHAYKAGRPDRKRLRSGEGRCRE